MPANSDTSDLRRTMRLPVTPRGEIIDGDRTYKAIIQDVSDFGLLLVCSKEFTTGEILKLRLHLSPSAIVDCEIEVRHSNDLGTGVKIVSMDDLNRRAYERYLQEYFSQQLGKMG